MNKLLLMFTILMGMVVLISNYLVQFPIKYYGLEEILTYGAFSYPIAFLITDLVNRFYGKTVAKKVVYIGNSLWANNVALKEPALEKGIFTSFSKKKFGNFELEYYEVFDATPHQIAYLAFDLVGLISNLQKKNKKINVSNITDSNGFIGTNGLFRFRSDGSVQRSLSVFQIKNQNPIEVKKANLNF